MTSPIFAPPGGPQEGNVSLQTWLPDMRYYEEVVRRNNVPGTRWALVTLDENDEPTGDGAILVSLG